MTAAKIQCFQEGALSEVMWPVIQNINLISFQTSAGRKRLEGSQERNL